MLGPQFVPSDPTQYPARPGARHQLAHRLFGSNDVDALFNGAPKTTAPWPTASRAKGQPVFDSARVSEALSRPVELQDFDPRNLHATQPWVVREHAQSYMNSEHYETTGDPVNDKADLANQYPLVYRKGNGQDAILSGHHRAAKALLRGEPLKARVAYSARRMPQPPPAA